MKWTDSSMLRAAGQAYSNCIEYTNVSVYNTTIYFIYFIYSISSVGAPRQINLFECVLAGFFLYLEIYLEFFAGF